jgi:hypothetical protein
MRGLGKSSCQDGLMLSSTKVGIRRLLGLLNHGKLFFIHTGHASRANQTVEKISTATKLRYQLWKTEVLE